MSNAPNGGKQPLKRAPRCRAGVASKITLEKGKAMADLIAIGYPDEATAEAAAQEARRQPRT